jgi:hypothetical protein
MRWVSQHFEGVDVTRIQNDNETMHKFHRLNLRPQCGCTWTDYRSSIQNHLSIAYFSNYPLIAFCKIELDEGGNRRNTTICLSVDVCLKNWKQLFQGSTNSRMRLPRCPVDDP